LVNSKTACILITINIEAPELHHKYDSDNLYSSIIKQQHRKMTAGKQQDVGAMHFFFAQSTATAIILALGLCISLHMLAEVPGEPRTISPQTNMMPGERQSANAIRFYESKSGDYDDTWHDDFTTRFLSYLELQPGQEVLDLACGTGLLTFKEADAVGPTGKVVGVDVTPGMLATASRKKEQGGDKYTNIELIRGDILHLEEIEALKGRKFDVVTVASALVLFPNPKAAVEHWSTYLKPGGKLVVDSTHPRNLVAGMVLERVARRLDLPIPYNRTWSRSESALQKMLESAGLEVESVVTVHNQAGYGKRYYDVDQWDDFFVENVIVKDVARTFANNDVRRKAQSIYKEEWEKLAVDGKVEEIDAVFLAVARRRTSTFLLNPSRYSILTNTQLPMAQNTPPNPPPATTKSSSKAHAAATPHNTPPPPHPQT
jgi:ubiquinone/menaquinone biosynthesis C-methylase UbiE